MVRIHNHFFASLLAAAVLAACVLRVPSAWADTYTNVVINRTAGGQVVGSATSNTDSQGHALVWLSDGTLVDLNSAGFAFSNANGTNGFQQVGSGVVNNSPVGQYAQALLWSGTAGSVVDLKPATGYDTSTVANAISPNGTQQVGTGYGSATNYSGHALLWSGTADSMVDLHPTNLTGLDRSFANGTDGTHQVGYFQGTATGNEPNAALWSGTADSAVNLHPASGYISSIAYGVSGTQQVGYANTTAQYNPQHAMLWTGTAESAVDLNPATYKSSAAYSTNGTNQVGYGQDASYQPQALLWSGTADSVVDLTALLPADGTWTFSVAYNINDAGDVFGLARGTLNGVNDAYAIEWTPVAAPGAGGLLSAGADAVTPDYTSTVLYEAAAPAAPEPASLALLGMGMTGLLMRRKRLPRGQR